MNIWAARDCPNLGSSAPKILNAQQPSAVSLELGAVER